MISLILLKLLNNEKKLFLFVSYFLLYGAPSYSQGIPDNYQTNIIVHLPQHTKDSIEKEDASFLMVDYAWRIYFKFPFCIYSSRLFQNPGWRSMAYNELCKHPAIPASFPVSGYIKHCVLIKGYYSYSNGDMIIYCDPDAYLGQAQKVRERIEGKIWTNFPY